MFAVVILKNGQPIRAVTERHARRAHRTARLWKQQIRTSGADHAASYTVLVSASQTARGAFAAGSYHRRGR